MIYRAFFSYSRADEKIASWLHRCLEAFRTPGPLIGADGSHGRIPESLHPIFRDRTDLHAGGRIDQALQHALENSEALVILCSPASAASTWVNHECQTFLDLGRRSRIFPVIVDGEPDSADPTKECFPPALRGIGMLAADMRETLQTGRRTVGDGRDLGFLKLAAGLLGVSLDDLVERDKHRYQHRIAWLSAAVFLFAAVAIAAINFALVNVDQAAKIANQVMELQDASKESSTQRQEASRQAALASDAKILADAQADALQLQKEAADLLRKRTHATMLASLTSGCSSSCRLARPAFATGDLDAALAAYIAPLSGETTSDDLFLRYLLGAVPPAEVKESPISPVARVSHDRIGPLRNVLAFYSSRAVEWTGRLEYYGFGDFRVALLLDCGAASRSGAPPCKTALYADNHVTSGELAEGSPEIIFADEIGNVRLVWPSRIVTISPRKPVPTTTVWKTPTLVDGASAHLLEASMDCRAVSLGQPGRIAIWLSLTGQPKAGISKPTLSQPADKCFRTGALGPVRGEAKIPQPKPLAERSLWIRHDDKVIDAQLVSVPAMLESDVVQPRFRLDPGISASAVSGVVALIKERCVSPKSSPAGFVVFEGSARGFSGLAVTSPKAKSSTSIDAPQPGRQSLFWVSPDLQIVKCVSLSFSNWDDPNSGHILNRSSGLSGLTMAGTDGVYVTFAHSRLGLLRLPIDALNYNCFPSERFLWCVDGGNLVEFVPGQSVDDRWKKRRAISASNLAPWTSAAPKFEKFVSATEVVVWFEHEWVILNTDTGMPTVWLAKEPWMKELFVVGRYVIASNSSGSFQVFEKESGLPLTEKIVGLRVTEAGLSKGRLAIFANDQWLVRQTAPPFDNLKNREQEIQLRFRPWTAESVDRLLTTK